MASWVVLVAVLSAAEPNVLFTEQRLISPISRDFAFTLPAVPAGRQARLALRARCDWVGFGGHNPFLGVRINGQVVAPDQLVNKPVEFTMYDGSDASWWGQGLWRLLYSPSFEAFFGDDPPAYMVADADPYRFVWDITSYVQPGSNTLTLSHPKLLAEPTTVVVADAAIDVGEPLHAPIAGASEVGGTLPTYLPPEPRTVPMTVTLSPGGALRVAVGRRTLTLATRTGEPDGRWAATAGETGATLVPGAGAEAGWQGTGYRVRRRVTLAADHLTVADTLTNTTDRLLGVIVEHRLATDAPPAERLLGGRRVYKARQTTESPGNPTALVQWPDLAVAMAAEDDVFRVHHEAFSEPDAIGLRDARLGLAPGASHTLEWSLYLAPGGDYWDIVNALRRDWGSNFTIPGPSLIESNLARPETAEEGRGWLARRGAPGFIIAGQQTFPDGLLAEGTAIPQATAWNAAFRRWKDTLHQADPRFQALLYLHSEISTEQGAQAKYADCKVLNADGSQAVSPYTYPVYLFLPRPDNAYGQALAKTVEYMLDDLGADGIYNDCFTHDTAAYAYGPPWDGCTVTIDPQTHATGRAYSSVVLLQQPWKAWLAQAHRRRGKLLIGNGPLYTRTMLRLQVPTFTETNSFSFLVDTHLSCPWGLGTHPSDNTPRGRMHMARRMLDYGGVYSVYTWPGEAQTDTFVRYLFPITPMALRPGVLMGRERILTNRSGRFGWPDGAAADVHAFDAEGREVAQPEVTEVREGGRRLTEVKVPAGGLAVLVRR